MEKFLQDTNLRRNLNKHAAGIPVEIEDKGNGKILGRNAEK